MRQVQAVLFDMDGLMVDTERVAARAWEKAGNEVGLVIGEEWLSTIRGTSLAVSKEKFQAFYGDAISFDVLHQRKSELMLADLKENGIPVKKGLRELLHVLKEKKILTALATSTKEETARWYLSTIGVLEYFDAFACGDMVTHCKPDPEIFLLAASKLGKDPENCMVLEDSLQGIEAAYLGNFMPVMVPDLTLPTEDTKQKLYAECEDLLEVVTLL